MVREGDHLSALAQRFRTSASAIVALNPGLRSRGLRAGMTLSICPGKGYAMRQDAPTEADIETAQAGVVGVESAKADGSARQALYARMRLVWLQHVYWTRMVLLSIAERLADQTEVTARLMQNPQDIAEAFAHYHHAAATKPLERLLTEHLQTGGELITALRDGDMAQAERLNNRWYTNADDMASALNDMNPYYDYADMREMLYTHLELTAKEVALRLAREYAADIAAFGEVEREALDMSDALSGGLMKLFPQKF